jgi:hypothetical protein
MNLCDVWPRMYVPAVDKLPILKPWLLSFLLLEIVYLCKQETPHHLDACCMLPSSPSVLVAHDACHSSLLSLSLISHLAPSRCCLQPGASCTCCAHQVQPAVLPPGRGSPVLPVPHQAREAVRRATPRLLLIPVWLERSGTGAQH